MNRRVRGDLISLGQTQTRDNLLHSHCQRVEHNLVLESFQRLPRAWVEIILLVTGHAAMAVPGFTSSASRTLQFRHIRSCPTRIFHTPIFSPATSQSTGWASGCKTLHMNSSSFIRYGPFLPCGRCWNPRYLLLHSFLTRILVVEHQCSFVCTAVCTPRERFVQGKLHGNWSPHLQ